MNNTILEIFQSQLQGALTSGNMRQKDQTLRVAQTHLRPAQRKLFLEFYAALSAALQIRIHQEILNLTYDDIPLKGSSLRKRIRVLKTTHRQRSQTMLEAQIKCLTRHYQLTLKVSQRETFYIG